MNLSDFVAEEIRVQLVRRRMTQRELAERLNRPAAWVSRRMIDPHMIAIDELRPIAEAIGLTEHELIEAALEAFHAHAV